ncbi:Uncharacterised protein [Salmonella enterica subsp. enterica serovar Daytona]|uniref:Uncharacterized protein n=1 Tax=Salmonella enterica subsp. enterica serovar Daytona TaxID=1962639 RepID=A0A447JI26_SALET|nr:Uncharacterised protein [Salmonella enterica subsp. enterica serovar Daytona]
MTVNDWLAILLPGYHLMRALLAPFLLNVSGSTTFEPQQVTVMTSSA